jgi:hypothetical protein
MKSAGPYVCAYQDAGFKKRGAAKRETTHEQDSSGVLKMTPQGNEKLAEAAGRNQLAKGDYIERLLALLS